ncbi:hypothetical protein [Legionella worsleiensis]|uniref:Dot/Icm T4SS effector n=1 Tax=Legionella worsleiensis TaxID=45076 RepID=A0A0W1AIT2_9GAMM|nr:hypothetical protein [Legionella worsleiensis]KTD81172.1 Dot/Icm T4SS effector [Legionella worsleiensis]STY33147.1 Dot/Icm T4SS effector [Legionella worsleiensis]
MSFELVAYKLLKQRIMESIATLIIAHAPSEEEKKRLQQLIAEHSYSASDSGSDEKYLEFLWNKLEKISGPRQVQSRVLLKTIELLNGEDDLRKAALVLNTLAFYIHEKIVETYSGICSFVTSPDSSTLKRGLYNSLNLKDNVPNDIDLAKMYEALLEFLNHHVYVEGFSPEGYLHIQPFDIKEYSVEDDINDLTLKQAHAVIKNNNAAKVKYKQSGGSLKSSSSIFSSSPSQSYLRTSSTPSAEPVPMPSRRFS